MITKTEIDTIQQYTFDASNLKGFCDRVYLPESTAELSKLVRECNSNEERLTIAGAGTGLTGGRVPEHTSVVSLERFKRLTMHGSILTAGAGCSWQDANEYTNLSGYFIGPNPTEYSASIGGNINTNASGSRTYKYGSFRDSIISLSGVWANGNQFKIVKGEYILSNGILQMPPGSPVTEITTEYINWPETKNATGYKLVEGADLLDLLIGSEGTLAVTAECEIQTIIAPQKVLGLIVFLSRDDNPLALVDSIKHNTILSPRLIEFFDINALAILREKYSQIPENADSALWIEEEHEDIDLGSIIQYWYDQIQNFSDLAEETWIAEDESKHKFFSEFRHHLPERIYERIGGSESSKIGTDSAVPDWAFASYFDYTNSILVDSGIEHIVFGHIGNNHLHANLFPTFEQQEEANNVYTNLMRKALESGGTVSAEHGIGKLKKSYFRNMYGEKGINTMIEIKKQLDPYGILNHGNLF